MTIDRGPANDIPLGRAFWLQDTPAKRACDQYFERMAYFRELDAPTLDKHEVIRLLRYAIAAEYNDHPPA